MTNICKIRSNNKYEHLSTVSENLIYCTLFTQKLSNLDQSVENRLCILPIKTSGANFFKHKVSRGGGEKKMSFKHLFLNEVTIQPYLTFKNIQVISHC